MIITLMIQIIIQALTDCVWSLAVLQDRQPRLLAAVCPPLSASAR